MALHPDHLGRAGGPCPIGGSHRGRPPPRCLTSQGKRTASRAKYCLGSEAIPGSPGIAHDPYDTGRFSYGVERTMVVRELTLTGERMRARRSSSALGVATRTLRMYDSSPATD